MSCIKSFQCTLYNLIKGHPSSQISNLTLMFPYIYIVSLISTWLLILQGNLFLIRFKCGHLIFFVLGPLSLFSVELLKSYIKYLAHRKLHIELLTHFKICL